MKKILIAVAICSMFSASYAADGVGAGTVIGTPAGTTVGQSQGQTTSQTSTSDAVNAGNNQGVTLNIGASQPLPETTVNSIVSGGTTQRVEYGTQTIRNTPSVSGSPLTSSNDTCMGSATGALNVPGFGVGLGKTYTDSNCVLLKNSRELWNMGMKGAAMALMCMDSNNKAALEMTGYVCPQSRKDQAVVQGEPTDPYVRQRMGLAAQAQ